ncbi:hypothetical protein SNEBB_007086 [Seison nebaliae]|nr:hypothetical protein SNEBB_007086 [Seison nebaliae]
MTNCLGSCGDGECYKDEREMKRKSKKEEWKELCMKCSKRQSVLRVHYKDAMCKSCFLESFQHRIRSTIGKYKLISRNSILIVDVLNSQEAISLKNVLQLYEKSKFEKRLSFNSIYLFIYHENVVSEMSEHNDIIFLPLSHIFVDIEKWKRTENYFAPIQQAQSKLDQFFQMFSRKEETLEIVKLRLLVKFGRFLQSTQIEESNNLVRNLFGEKMINRNSCRIALSGTSTDMAVKTMTAMSIGAGSNIHKHAGIRFTLILDDYSIDFVRPLREIPTRECLLYVHHMKLNNKILKNCRKKFDDFQLHRYTTSHMLSLAHGNFPTVINATMRIVEKTLNHQRNDNCRFCCGNCEKSIDQQTTTTTTNKENDDNYDKRFCYYCLRLLNDDKEKIKELLRFFQCSNVD